MNDLLKNEPIQLLDTSKKISDEEFVKIWQLADYIDDVDDKLDAEVAQRNLALKKDWVIRAKKTLSILENGVALWGEGCPSAEGTIVSEHYWRGVEIERWVPALRWSTNWDARNIAQSDDDHIEPDEEAAFLKRMIEKQRTIIRTGDWDTRDRYDHDKRVWEVSTRREYRTMPHITEVIARIQKELQQVQHQIDTWSETRHGYFYRTSPSHAHRLHRSRAERIEEKHDMCLKYLDTKPFVPPATIKIQNLASEYLKKYQESS